ncbi:SMP-30/gluconolactonase/LRE family protein [Hirschia baltica]|uniref:Gluconolactonase n=1 Tax=Hirschia baltica (strain ATCC 49814 / DSM 5838 / IFAM 1418) TaxID=582402 RepID=C6XIE0_HIRBI|nr:SMP-30/gluconolactonase/LRE family protein [Hirschia baltica]ACT60747.1 Gluconolactonase [Hirschia baltica ATCC 49814]
MISRRTYLLGSGALAIAACTAANSPVEDNGLVTLEAFDPDFAKYIAPDASAISLSTGHQWLEGPAWDSNRETLYFTDVPQNIAYAWNQADGVSTFLKPSGSDVTTEDGFREPGANGLWYEDGDTLLICNHGKRALERLDLKSGTRTQLVSSFEGKKFNSPNDVAKAKNGDLFFTDPPYGLTDLDASPLKEMKANGVYVLTSENEILRLLEDMTFPNGIAVSPDQKTILISQSDPENPIVRNITIDENYAVVSDSVFFDAKEYQSETSPGLPDGMAMVSDGALFVTGPGGVFLLSPKGKALGRINTGKATANCVFGEAGNTLFITAGDSLLKLPTLCHA